MREQLLSDDLRRDDAHGAVELPAPPLNDHGAEAQVAYSGTPPSAEASGLPPVLYGTRSAVARRVNPEGGYLTHSLTDAMATTQDMQAKYPAKDFRTSGQAQ